jgi:hypothetical protein
MSKWAMRAHFRHLRSKSFPIILRMPQAIEFWPFKLLFEILEVHRNSISQSGSCLGSVRVHSLTLSYTPGNMWCDSRASSWPATLQLLCLGRKPKARVATLNFFHIALSFYHIVYALSYFLIMYAFSSLYIVYVFMWPLRVQ